MPPLPLRWSDSQLKSLDCCNSEESFLYDLFSRNSIIKVTLNLGKANVLNFQTLEHLEVLLYNHLMFCHQKAIFAVWYHLCKSKYENRKSHTHRYKTVQSSYIGPRGKPFTNFISFLMTGIQYL